MNVNNALRDRRLGLSRRVEIDFAIDQIRLKEMTKLMTLPNEEENFKTNGPLACCWLSNGVMAVANEDGCINLLNTRKLDNITQWFGHANAIFDIKASPDKKTLMTASGDTSIKKWDVETKKVIETITAHHSSIKSLSIYDSNTLASGSRDGSIKIHDLRQKNPTIIVIPDAHRNQKIAKSRKSSAKTDPISCVTNVAFDPYYPRLYSTGANDAKIKLWDLRGRTTVNKPRRSLEGHLVMNQPYIEVDHPIQGIHCGYSHLILSSCRVYAACSDNKIYCYSNFGSSEKPIRFTGCRYDPFLKLAVMDERFLLCGAKGGGAMVWSLGNKRSSMYYPETTKQPVGQLRPDDEDRFDTNVIDTDWDSLSIITLRDDRLVCKWSMQHVLESERRKLAEQTAPATARSDVTIEMSDIIDVNVLRPNHRLSNTNTA